MHEPTVTIVTVVPDTVHTPVVVEAKLTVSHESDVRGHRERTSP